jgi:hypothetical protein
LGFVVVVVVVVVVFFAIQGFLAWGCAVTCIWRGPPFLCLPSKVAGELRRK